MYRVPERGLMVIAIFMLAVVYVGAASIGKLGWTSPPLLIVIGLAAMWMAFDIPKASRRRIRRYINDPENARFKLKQKATFGDEGIQHELEDGSMSVVKWTSVIKHLKTEKALTLFMSQVQLVQIPLEAFKSAQDRDEVLNLVGKVGEKP